MAGTMSVPEQQRRPLGIANLPEEVLSEILLRLPPKCTILCRAVCKAWRRFTSDRGFLLVHHRRQPPRRLLSFVRGVGAHGDHLGLVDYCVEAVDLRTHEFRSVVRFTGEEYDPCLEEDGPFVVHAACDLLMPYDCCLYLCNPTTRQWISVFPPARLHDKVAGLYSRGPSSEYRVLYHRSIADEPAFCITTVGTGRQRLIWPHSSPRSVRELLARGSEDINFKEPFLFHSNLHWLLHLPRCSNILAFNMLDEVFWCLRAPVYVRSLVSSLSEIEGTLALSVSDIEASKVDLWLLQDYELMV